MPAGATGDIKLGFYVGIGVALAMAIFGLVQALLSRAVRGGG